MTAWVSRYQRGKTGLDLSEARDEGVLGCSGISWTICKQSAPRCRQIITPVPRHSIFTGWMLFLTLDQRVRALKANNNNSNMKYLWCCHHGSEPLREFTWFTWWMQTQCQMAANPQTKPNNLGCESACRLLPFASAITRFIVRGWQKWFLTMDVCRMRWCVLGMHILIGLWAII